MDYELILFDRINVIKDVITKYGVDNFYLSFSGGKDSTILHYLLDIALPNNNIPRVFINTGIEYKPVVDFVIELASKDDRFVMLKPSTPIIPMLTTYGYPFKSKEHSTKLHEWQKGNRLSKSIKRYITGLPFQCPNILLYQFTDDFNLNVSPFCCLKLKKEPIKKWAKQNNKSIVITGMRKQEGGQRTTLNCILTDKFGKVVKFHPLAKVDENWENDFIEHYDIHLCKLYYPPYNFKRTGCAGCPFAINLQDQLDIMSLYLPNERKKCEIIWKPVYAEYRRLGYRLRNDISIFD